MSNIYAGAVMTSFDYVITPTRGNWFLKNHQIMNRVITRLIPQCETYGMSATFVILSYYMVAQASWNNKQELDIGTCESLVSFCILSFDILSLWLILTKSLQKINLKDVTNFIPLK